MSGRRALRSAWRAVVTGLTVAGWAEKSSYYNLTATGDPDPTAPATAAPVTMPA
jgi:hypothetical protein